jgi:hypothetical protein
MLRYKRARTELQIVMILKCFPHPQGVEELINLSILSCTFLALVHSRICRQSNYSDFIT